MSIEQRLEQVERQTKRLRIAVVVLAAALCGVVSMAARQYDRLEVGTLKATSVYAKYIAIEELMGGRVVAGISSADNSERLFTIGRPEGGNLIEMGYDKKGGVIRVRKNNGQGVEIVP